MPVLSFLFFFLSFLSFALAALVNISIDDTFGDPVTGQQFSYTPPTSWNIGQSCVACTARPDPNSTFDHTWHDGTFNPLPGSNDNPNQPIFASVQFNGSAVYVYCILAHTSSGPDGNSDMTFFLDNKVVGTFSLAPTGAQQYDYNVPVFANPSVPPGMHTLTVQTGHVNGSKSLMLLDYVVYTTEQNVTVPSATPSTNATFPFSTIHLSSSPSSTSSSSSSSELVSSPPSLSTTIPTTSSAAPSAALVAHSSPNSKKSSVLLIVGILVGVIALAALVAAALVLYHRRRRSLAAQPFAHPSSPPRLDAAPADFMISRQGLLPLSVPEQDGSSTLGASLSPSSSCRHPYGITQARQVVHESTPSYGDSPTQSEPSSHVHLPDPEEAFGTDVNSLIDAPPAYDPDSQPSPRWSRKGR